MRERERERERERRGGALLFENFILQFETEIKVIYQK